MRILVAVGNNDDARIFLTHFLQAMGETKYLIRIAAYQKSSPPGINVSWTLDALLNPRSPESLQDENNDNFNILYQQIKKFSPDLVISDLEFFCSRIANLLNIPLWQCSSSLIHLALTKKEKKWLNVYSYSAALYVKNTNNILDNSDRKFIYSHLGDFEVPPELIPGFEFVRPYHRIGKISRPCAHHLVAACRYSNKKMLHLVQKYPDPVVFAGVTDEYYQGIQLKSLDQQEEFACNLRNCDLFICEGQTSALADAYFNGKFAIVLPDLFNLECVINAAVCQKKNLSKTIYDEKEDLSPFLGISSPIEPLNPKIFYLHQLISMI